MTITDNSTQVIVVEIEAPQTPVRVITPGGLPGENGDPGTNGWSPKLANVADGARRVLQVYDWVGGTGDKPAVGQYIGATGLVTLITDGLDVRGVQGPAGAQGPAGTDGAVIIGGDDEILTGHGAPNDADGADNQLYFDLDTSDLYKKLTGHWTLQANLKGQQGPAGADGQDGPEGAPGPAGADGNAGAAGAPGIAGWTPVFATATDGLRRVLRVTDWTGGGGTKPVVGKYVGTSGFVDSITDGVDIRGPTGAAGADGADGAPGADGAQGPAGPDGADGATGAPGTPGPVLNPTGAWNSATTYAKYDEAHVAGVGSFYSRVDGNINNAPASSPTQWYQYAVDGAQGPAGADGADGPAGADGSTGAPGDNGWSPVFTMATDGARRVLQVSDWTGGSGTKPATGKYVGAAGLVTLIGDGVDVRGPSGADGATGPAGADGDNAAMTLASKSAAYTTVLADANNGILHPAADTAARTFTIDSNANVAYPVGTILTFINQHGAGVVTIAITSDTMRLASTGATGSRTLAADGMANAVKITSTEWLISGVGLT